MLFDYMGISLNSDKSKGKKLSFNWIDQNGKPHGFWVEDEVLMYREGKPVQHPDAVITGDQLNFALVAMQAMPLKEALNKGTIKIEGNPDKIQGTDRIHETIQWELPHHRTLIFHGLFNETAFPGIWEKRFLRMFQHRVKQALPRLGISLS